MNALTALFSRGSSTVQSNTAPAFDDRSVSSMLIEINELKVKHLTERASSLQLHVHKVVRSGTQIIHFPRKLGSPDSTALSWTVSTLTINKLAVRPSSLLYFKFFDSRGSESPVTEFIVSFASIVSGARHGSEYCVYTIHNDRGVRLAVLSVSISILLAPIVKQYNQIPELSNLANFSDVRSQQVAILLRNYMVLQTIHSTKVQPLVKSFIVPTLSILWTTIEYDGRKALSKRYQSRAQLTPYNALTGAPDTNPLQEVISQMNDLVVSLMDPKSEIFKDHQPLLDEVFAEFCICTGELEYAIDIYRGWTWEQATISGKSNIYRTLQQSLFTLRYKTAFLLHQMLRYVYDTPPRNQVVLQLLHLAIEEDRRRPRLHGNPLTPEERSERPFTTVLASPRGHASDIVWEDFSDALRTSSGDPALRDACRRAMVRLIQSTDRLPSSLRVVITEIEGICGTGAFAMVYRGKARGNEDVAIKVPTVLRHGPGDLKSRRELYLEIISWTTLQHHRSLPFLGVGAIQNLGDFCLISPFMTRGSLSARYYDRSRPPVDPNVRLRHLIEIVEGMIYLHAEGIVHGDLRAANIFVDTAGHVQISDFGLSVFAEGFSKNYYSMRSGNVRWTAPELLRPTQYNQHLEVPDIKTGADTVVAGRPTKRSDVYTFALLCIELHTGDAPFADQPETWIWENVPAPRKIRPGRPNNMVSHQWELLQSCWCDNATRRLDFTAVYRNLQRSV